MPRITKTPQAEADIINHAVYLYVSAPEADASERFLSATETAFARLAEMPGLGVAQAFASPRLAGIRRWPVPGFRNHLIFYRETEDGIDIVRVLDGAQDIAGLFMEDEGQP